NVWETNNTTWVQADHVTPNRRMDASFYVQNDALAGQTLTFIGTCLSNTLVSPPDADFQFTSSVFIKQFNASYTLTGSTEVPLVGGQPFSISLATKKGDHIQYGFE